MVEQPQLLRKVICLSNMVVEKTDKAGKTGVFYEKNFGGITMSSIV